MIKKKAENVRAGEKVQIRGLTNGFLVVEAVVTHTLNDYPCTTITVWSEAGNQSEMFEILTRADLQVDTVPS
jgi:hypothetical protein